MGPLRSPRLVAVVAVLLAVGGCAARDAEEGAVAPEPSTTAAPPASHCCRQSTLTVDSTWQWQLQGTVNTGYDVDVYDIDLFDSPTALIDELHADGRTVVCYFSAGSFEDWRPDVDAFAPEALGRTLDGYDTERWLDVRHPSVRAVMADRLDLAVTKGCNGVEPDNVDGFTNDPGFPLAAADQLDFNRFLASAAHERGLLVGLKNDLDQIPALVDDFDFAVNEQCVEYDECDALLPFVDAGKPVFSAEYDPTQRDDPDAMCAAVRALGLRTLVLPQDLDDSFRVSCDG